MFKKFFLILFLGQCLSCLAWTPTHRVETRRGRVYLRALDSNSVLFAFRPRNAEAAAVIENSILWDPDFIQAQSGGQVAELKLGQALELSKESKVYCFLEPVTGRLSLEVRHRRESETKSRRWALDLQGASEPFVRKLSLRTPEVDHIYGLGEHFPENRLGKTDIDLKGRVRHSGTAADSFLTDPLGVYGNSMTPLAGGNVGNALFPLLYLTDNDGPDAMLFLSNAADSRWDFRRRPWDVSLRFGEIEGALAWGEESESLRARYLNWTGRPPVPPRKALGLWVSEYGYENWDELEQKLEGLRNNLFPIDGFVLDLQWFGGITTGSEDSQMGTLTFDEQNFPQPAQKIADLARRGLGIIVIEESYIASKLAEFQDLAARGYLVKAPKSDQPHIIDRNPWWGIGSMLDYTNPEAAAYWHNTKRKPLMNMGIVGHWTDLGEPEVFRHKAGTNRRGSKYTTPVYHGEKEQLEVNNLFGISWAKSIFEGYGADGHESGRRPLILARTGTSGIQRFGAALWSGDIGANWKSLRNHYAAQSQMSFSGVDYFGSDVGGFYRQAFDASESSFDEMYTRWFAAACLTDIPLRPHTMNLGNKYETSPDRVGDKASNLFNLRLRYRLIPYLYSACYEAWLKGSPVVAPYALGSTEGSAADTSGTLKRIGPSLLAQLVLRPNSESIECPLPEGSWYDFTSGALVKRGPAKVIERPTVDGRGRFVTPMFASQDSVVAVGSAESSQQDNSRLELFIFPGPNGTTARVYHDDGVTEAYRGGDFAVTEIQQSPWKGRYGSIRVKAVSGNYASQLPAERDLIIHLASPRKGPEARVGEEIFLSERTRLFHSFTIPAVPTNQEIEIRFQ